MTIFLFNDYAQLNKTCNMVIDPPPFSLIAISFTNRRSTGYTANKSIIFQQSKYFNNINSYFLRNLID